MVCVFRVCVCWAWPSGSFLSQSTCTLASDHLGQVARSHMCYASANTEDSRLSNPCVVLNFYVPAPQAYFCLPFPPPLPTSSSSRNFNRSAHSLSTALAGFSRSAVPLSSHSIPFWLGELCLSSFCTSEILTLNLNTAWGTAMLLSWFVLKYLHKYWKDYCDNLFNLWFSERLNVWDFQTLWRNWDWNYTSNISS